MHILLCAATEFEIKPTIDTIEKQNLNNIDILITGVGLTAAAYSLTKKIYTKKPGLILQAGIAGCFNKNFSLTDVVVVKNEIIGDLGVEENGKFNSLFDLKLDDANAFPWANGRLCNNSEVLQQSGLTVVNSVSINEITTSAEKINYYKTTIGADIESMEGAALHYVALMENIPFLQLRSLSNFVGERDKSKWLMREAIMNLNLQLQNLILKLTR
ncbi:MAG: futalosine hydrolase [Flavisolibacter sp.]